MSQSANQHPTAADREAGVLLHITSLPGPYGIGEIGAHARGFIDRMRDMKLAVWQFLPTGPTAYGDSPYQALSTFAGNEMLKAPHCKSIGGVRRLSSADLVLRVRISRRR